MKTIATIIHNKTFSLIIRDSNGNTLYYEDSHGDWWMHEYDDNGRETFYEDVTGFWAKYEYDDNGNETRYEDSTGWIDDTRP